MSTRSTSSRGDCQPCVRKRREGHNNARDAKYCPRHQCPHADVMGVMCTERKKAAEIRCSVHTRCKVSTCNSPRTSDTRGLFTEYCINHNCVVIDCDEGKAHDPKRNSYNDLCATHLASKCQASGCVDWKSVNGKFCFQHTCAIERCNKKTLNLGGRPFCEEHNKCNVAGCQNPRCQFGSRIEAVCQDHYLAPCNLGACSNKASASTTFCDLHSCRYTDQKRCKKEARPGRGKPYCEDHACLNHDCQILRSFREVNGALVMNDFCPMHECKQTDCVKHNVPDKSYCNSHCCTVQSCKQAREGDPRFGTLCYTHHGDRIAQRAVDERLAEIRLAEEREATRVARAAEDARRRARRQEEEDAAQAEQDARMRREEESRRQQAAADTARRADPRRNTRSPPRPSGEGLRPGNAFNGYDEGYRSNRSSGGSFRNEDGW